MPSVGEEEIVKVGIIQLEDLVFSDTPRPWPRKNCQTSTFVRWTNSVHDCGAENDQEEDPEVEPEEDAVGVPEEDAKKKCEGDARGKGYSMQGKTSMAKYSWKGRTRRRTQMAVPEI